MKLKPVNPSMARAAADAVTRVVTCAVTCAATCLLAACGGGSSVSNSNPTIPTTVTTQAVSLNLHGTAASGMAISGAIVDIKCRTGNATTKTATDGSFDVSITNGALPCVLETSDPASARKLHAIAISAGVINLTPLTEMLSTRLMHTSMTTVFNSPDADAINKTATDANTKTAQAEISKMLSGLLDTGQLIDFYSTPLKAATSSNPGAGDAQDKILDTLNLTLASSLFDPVLQMLAKANSINDLVVLGQPGCVINNATGTPIKCSSAEMWSTEMKINVAPAAVLLPPGANLSFTANINYPPNVNYVRQPVKWVVLEADGGSVSTSGVYTAPGKPGTYHVQAQREDFPTLTTTALVVVDSVSPGFIPTLSVDNQIVRVMPGANIALQASNNYPPGINYIRQPVTWTLLEPDGGTISLQGNYTAPQKTGLYHAKVQRDDFPMLYVVVNLYVNYPPD